MSKQSRGQQLPLVPNANCPQDWRLNREVRFTWRQQHAREWISFREIAEWLSELDGRGVPNEAARANAYDMLARDFLSGDFEEHGRSKVLYLNYRSRRARMTRAKLQAAIDTPPSGDIARSTDIIRSEYLERCWIRRRMLDRWLAKHELPRSPSRFLPAGPQSSVTPPATPRKQGIRRRGPKVGTVARYDEGDRALFPTMDALIPQLGGSTRAAALQLAWDGKVDGKGTEESRAKRLERKYLKHKNSLPLTPTKSH
jgi:hypothetical protein